ncbi:hypothetical protein FRX31_023220 [Thalictrum thalictroides]|uniref:Uncharacterized protein n=1 Tax=Thalictrum thalictroides TaxID=46969 RepID=A0A7J6VQP7_THATH|nr:hypothetical protein FRX31_023220 [Thalictrum thalictroides]
MVKVTCIAAGDKQIVSYVKTKINGRYSIITIEGYDYAKYGRNGCKTKLIYLVPKASPPSKKQPTDENLTRVDPQMPAHHPPIAYYVLALQWPCTWGLLRRFTHNRNKQLLAIEIPIHGQDT